jgi:predicted PurR-regulated permease PerM
VPTPVSPAGTVLTPQLRILLGAASVVVIIFGLRAAAPVLNAFLLALVIAQSLSPLAEILTRRGVKPVWAAVISVVLVLIVGVTLIGLLGNSLSRLVAELPNYERGLVGLREQVVETLARFNIDTQQVLRSDVLSPGRIVALATAFVQRLAGTLGHALLVLLLVAFMLIDLALLKGSTENHHPGLRWMREAERYGSDIRSYVRITGIAGLIAAAANLVVLEVLRVDFAITWAVLSFFLSFVPVVGFAMALLPPACIALLEFGVGRALMVAAGYLIINFVVDNIIKPRFMQEGFEISILEVFFSLLFWGWVLGPVGTILAVPLTLTVRRLRERFS